MQYYFTDINEAPKYKDDKFCFFYKPVEDVSEFDYIDMINLSEQLPFLEILNVKGREILGRNIETRMYKNFSVGSKRKSSRMGSNTNISQQNELLSISQSQRNIVIKYKVDFKTQADIPGIIEKINNVFYGHTEFYFTFTDEMDFYYKGIATQTVDVKIYDNSLIGEIELMCLDPFKYSRQVYETEVLKDEFHLYGVHLLNLDVELNKNNFLLENKKGDFIKFVFDKSFKNLSIDFLNYESYADNVRVDRFMDIKSDFEFFQINNINELMINEKFKLKYRRKVL